MFNQSYIDDFEKSDMYRKVLNNPNYLEKIKIEYLKKYGDESNAYFLAFKESLDHYVAKQISENKDYINSNGFRNYFNYIKEIVNQNTVQYGKNKLFLELNTNVVFEYLDESALQKIIGKNNIKINIEKNEKIIKNIMERINRKEFVSDEEIKMISIYFDNKKDFKDSEFGQSYSSFIKYIFNNKQTLKSSPELISSILTFLPSYYREGTENVRSFIAKYDDFEGKREIKWAHSNGSYKYTAFEITKFKDIQLFSDKSLGSSRTYKENDLMFLLFVQFHELTHQVQKNKVFENTFNIDAVPYEIKNLLNSVYKDYGNSFYGKNNPRNFEGNHDSDEIEIDADQNGWRKLGAFIIKFMDKNEKNSALSRSCYRNAKAINCRRAFSLKESPINRKKYRTIDYDMIFASEAIKRNPKILNNFKHLKHIFTPQGQVNTDILFENEITMTPAGRTISNYILNYAPAQLFIDKINSNRYSKNEMINLVENFVQVSYANTLTLRELKNIDLKTFEETQTKFNIKERLDDVYNAYFTECASQLLKFSKILETVRPKLSDEYANSCYKFYLDYYKEMLGNINSPDFKK